jgi:F420H(2)-dependent quinone reductase
LTADGKANVPGFVSEHVEQIERAASSLAVDAYPDYADYQRKTDRQIPVFVLERIVGV